jgi:hypothetical protein
VRVSLFCQAGIVARDALRRHEKYRTLLFIFGRVLILALVKSVGDLLAARPFALGCRIEACFNARWLSGAFGATVFLLC